MLHYLYTKHYPHTRDPGCDGDLTPNKHFQIVRGPGATIYAKADAVFENQLIWIKDLQNANTNHQLIDTLRGANKALSTNTQMVERAYVPPAGNSVAYVWNMCADHYVINTKGTIQSQVGANINGGFSLVKYRGDGNKASTVGHGLSKTPEMVWFKNIDSGGTTDWVLLSPLFGDNGNLLKHTRINKPRKLETIRNDFPVGSPFDATRLPLGASGRMNGANNNMMAYCWHSVAGYSKMGTYASNNAVNGPTINCGFSPAVVMIFGLDVDTVWPIMDYQNQGATLDKGLLINDGAALQNVGKVTFTATGFHIQNNNKSMNKTGNYFYAAFAR